MTKNFSSESETLIKNHTKLKVFLPLKIMFEFEEDGESGIKISTIKVYQECAGRNENVTFLPGTFFSWHSRKIFVEFPRPPTLYFFGEILFRSFLFCLSHCLLDIIRHFLEEGDWDWDSIIRSADSNSSYCTFARCPLPFTFYLSPSVLHSFTLLHLPPLHL